MSYTTLSDDTLRTVAGKMFDLESVSVAVGRDVNTNQLKLIIRDEKTGASREVKLMLDATEAQAKRLIEFTAEEMGLIAGPPRLED